MYEDSQTRDVWIWTRDVSRWTRDLWRWTRDVWMWTVTLFKISNFSLKHLNFCSNLAKSYTNLLEISAQTTLTKAISPNLKIIPSNWSKISRTHFFQKSWFCLNSHSNHEISFSNQYRSIRFWKMIKMNTNSDPKHQKIIKIDENMTFLQNWKFP